jgi:hypothetical protein
MSPDEIEDRQSIYGGWERRRARSRATAIRRTLGRLCRPIGRDRRALPPPGATARRRAELTTADRRNLKVLVCPSTRPADAAHALRRTRRRYHPDRNGGDRSHEKALQAVIAAYTALKSARAFA